MRESLGKIDWNNELNGCMDINEMTTKFESIMKDQQDKYVPLQKTNSKSKHQSPWVNYQSLKAVKRKIHAWKRFQATKSHERYLDYVKQRNRLTKKLRKAKKCYEKKVAKEAPTNPKAFYRYVNSQKKKSTNFIRLKKQYSNSSNPEELTNTDSETAECR